MPEGHRIAVRVWDHLGLHPQSAPAPIAGHTDAVGSDSYNQKLSEARAGTVRANLTAHFQLDAANFTAVGFGKTRLYDAADPNGAINRRVQVTKLP